MALLISKTTFLEFLACPKNIWLKLHRPELAKEFALSSFELQLAEQGNEVELYARKLYPTAVLVTKTGDDSGVKTIFIMLLLVSMNLKLHRTYGLFQVN